MACAVPYTRRAVLAGAGDAASVVARRDGRDDMARMEEETPYGPMLKTINFADTVVRYICPLAFLYVATQGSEAFSVFLLAALNDEHGLFTLYADDSRRPDFLNSPGRDAVFSGPFWFVV